MLMYIRSLQSLISLLLLFIVPIYTTAFLQLQLHPHHPDSQCHTQLF